MKVRKVATIAFLCVLGALWGPKPAFADTITWDTPIGELKIPSLNQLEAFAGYDPILKQGVAGSKAPFWQAVKLSDG